MQLTNIKTGEINVLSANKTFIQDDENNKIMVLKTTFEDMDYFAYASILSNSSIAIEQNSGFNYILYDDNGLNPRGGYRAFKNTDGLEL